MAEDSPLKIPLDGAAGVPDSSASQTHKADLSRSDSEAKAGGLVKRALSKTTDKLARRQSGGDGKAASQSQLSQPNTPVRGHRHLFSLHRSRGSLKDFSTREVESGTGDAQLAQSEMLPSSANARKADPVRPLSASASQRNDDSPFITPGSPQLMPINSPGDPEKFASMRAGTQTLIQALQAIPWAEDPDNDDELMNHDAPAETDSDEDDRTGNILSSSIHAIFARARLGKKAIRSTTTSTLPTVHDNEDSPRNEEPSVDSSSSVLDEESEEDFEPHSPSNENINRSRKFVASPKSTLDLVTPTLESRGSEITHSTNGGTVKMERRAKLAEKLRSVYDLKDIHQVVAEMPCWLLRSILLQGFMYLTDTYLCFFAHLPSQEDQVLKSGFLTKKTQRTKRWLRHWFILKNDVLSWYQSPSDPYFPHGAVDLRYVTACESINDKDIRLKTHQKTIRLSADSTRSRDEWVKVIRKIMFRVQNAGDSVKIAIPYSAIMDVDRSSAMDFSETIEIKVVDKNDHYVIDSYFFAYFQDFPLALERIRDAVRNYRGASESSTTPVVVDSTIPRPAGLLPPARTNERAQTTPNPEPSKSSSGFKLTSFLRPTSTIVEGNESAEDFTHISRRDSSFVPVTTSPHSPVDVPPISTSATHHTYPPGTTPPSSASTSDYYSAPSRESTWSVGVPSWLKIPSRKTLGVSSATSRSAPLRSATVPNILDTASKSVSEVLSPPQGLAHSPSSSATGDFGYFSLLEAPETIIDADVTEKFRSTFAFDEKEKLLGVFPGYIFRLLPVFGRLYISTNYFSFRSSGPLATRTRMVLPLRDVFHTQNSKSFRFGHHGLVVIIRGHEELFFEFSDVERRAAFVTLLDRQLEDVHRREGTVKGQERAVGHVDKVIMEEFGPRSSLAPDAEFKPINDTSSDMFGSSTSSTFLTFKPKESLHFTFLTIGSRGDVQPYIALAKGLMADGHHCRIATHGEFKEWIEAHGIEFGYVGGDPAELMRICIENGTFTVSFLKEGLQKFRGWIDDLLKTSWIACQGTDVLVESPSAMGGIHIAEALRIPYFRAFTMTWTRTRAYPHAFAVPEHKMGGNYNYMSYVLFDQVFWRGTAGQINRWRRNTLGLQGTNLDKMEPHKIPFLYNFSPVVVPPPLDWPEWIRVTGYWFLDDANVGSKKWEPPQDLLDFIDLAQKEGKKLVYIGFGSIVVPDPKAMTRTVIEAILKSDVYAILSKGWSDRLVKKSADTVEVPEVYPQQVYPISSIPHDWLFQRIDAACHHGGAGTTGASLRAGIPTIIKPFFGDQFFWGDRVEALGIGAAVRKLTVDSLADALITATTDQKQIERARKIGERIRAENGVATAIEAIYRDLDYARSLVKGGFQQAPDRLVDDHDHDHDLDHDHDEHATIRDYNPPSSPADTRSGDSSGGGPASDWSVISDHDDRHRSL